jgi:hypothetical protein
MKTLFVSLIAISSLVVVVRGDQETLRDLARQQKGVELIVTRGFGPAELHEILKESDLIARIVVMDSGRSLLARDERSIDSEYTVQVVEQLFGRPARNAGEHLIVTKPGGTVVLEGYTVTSRELDFPSFYQGDEYVLFLKRDDTTGRYAVAYGAQGAFQNIAARVEQVSAIGLWKQRRGAVEMPLFLDEIRSVVSQVKPKN